MLRLTFMTENEGTDRLKTEVLWHKFTHFLEQACEATLRANLWRQLQGVNDSLLLLVHFLLCLDLLDLHGQVWAEDLEHLLVSLGEAHMLVLSLDDARLTLNDEEDLFFSKDDWMSQVCLVLETVTHLVHLWEAWWADKLRLWDRLALLVVDDHSGDVDMVNVWPVGHSCLNELWAHQEDRAVWEGDQTL